MAKKFIRIISWNIKGCGNPIKRRKVLAYLKARDAQIAFVQESHIAEDNEAQK